MDGIETLGIVGEVLSLIGLVCGLPLLLFGSLGRALEGTPVPTEIVIIHNHRTTLARWFADGDFHQRTLRPWEREHINGQDVLTAYISSKDPSHMRLQPRSALTSVCLALGLVLVAVGVLGLAASIIPLIIG